MNPLKNLCARFSLSAFALNALMSVYFATALNLPLWKIIIKLFPLGSATNLFFMGSLLVILVAFFYAILSLLSAPKIHKPILIFLLIASALANYFMLQYGIVIDSDMLENVLQTDPAESAELLNFTLIGMLLFLGVLPALFMYHTRVTYPQNIKQWAGFTALAVLALAMVAGVALLNYQTLAPTVRNNKQLRHMVVPNNYLNGAFKLIKRHAYTPAPEKPFVPSEAKKSADALAHKRPTLFVLVVGETARAANFSLGGYARDTNPELKKQNIIYYPNTASCGTSTAASVPCMFAGLNPSTNNSDTIKHHDNVLQLIKSAGLETLWLDNNSGCKGVCEGVEIQQTKDLERFLPKGATHEVFDTDMIKAWKERLPKTLDKDTLLVFHQKGSHGPAYYLRVPDEFKKFTPTCDKNKLQECSQEELVNSYDNTIAFTDHFLAQVIATLKQDYPHMNTAMIYASDHGESLGESGLYLHGMPYSMAPKEQTHVPMVLWLSDNYIKDYGVDENCVRKRAAAESFAHENMFHTLLHGLRIETSAKNETLSLLHGCMK